jgi:hypothetical protein
MKRIKLKILESRPFIGEFTVNISSMLFAYIQLIFKDKKSEKLVI